MKKCFRTVTLAAACCFAVGSAPAGDLPEGFRRVESVTIPVTSEKVINFATIETVTWGQIRGIHARYANGKAPGGNIRTMLFCDSTTNRMCSVYIAPGSWNNRVTVGSEKWIKPLVFTGAEVEVVFSDVVCDESVDKRPFTFGGHGFNAYWNRSTVWYGLELTGADGKPIATLVPCVREAKDGGAATAGFWDLVGNRFITRPREDYNPFVAGKLKE